MVDTIQNPIETDVELTEEDEKELDRILSIDLETTMYYDYPFESYACRAVADPDKDDYEMFGKFYTEKEQSRETKPLRTKLDTDAITRGAEISKQEYEAL